MNSTRFQVSTVALAALLSFAPLGMASTTAAGPYDAAIQSSVMQKLNKKDFKNVNSTVENGVVTLTGTVNDFQEKMDAAKQARKSDNEVKGVRNLIEVTGTNVPAAELQTTLARKIADDRIGYYDEAFNAISVQVHNGVATLSGYAADYPSYNDALALVENTRGIKDVVDNMHVLPLSAFDNSLRFRLYRSIYGNSVLSKYAMDPVRPIRIVVDNGNVALYGRVDSAMDKEIAGIQADQVFGGFSVENHLTTPNQVKDR